MTRERYTLYLDESGSFEDDRADARWQEEVSLVGGLLMPAGRLTDALAEQLLPEPVHCRDQYDKGYLDVLEQVRAMGGRLVVFENKERLKVVNGDTTYVNIISEGLVRLLRDLTNETPQGVDIDLVIATRKAVDVGYGIIPQRRYAEALEEKIIMALGRNGVNNCSYTLSFQDARVFRLLDFADIICNTWYTRRRRHKFSEEERARIDALYAGQMIYTVFEDAMSAYLKQLMLERHIGEAIYQVCALRKQTGFAAVRNQLVSLFVRSDRYEQETWLAQMSLLIGQYTRLRLYDDGIQLAENYIKYFLDPFMEARDDGDKPLKSIPFWRFDTDYFLLTMYDHIGNPVKCQEHLAACKANIASVNRSWEHIDYYFGFCIRELNVLMGRYAFGEVVERTQSLIEIFTEAQALFGMIKTYNDTQQAVRSELLGKVYGVRLEAMINLLHAQPQLLDEAAELSESAMREFDDPRDISRQYQWRCLLMCEAGRPDEAFEALMRAIDVADNAVPTLLEKLFGMRFGAYVFPLWHYTNVMLCLIGHGDPRGEAMADALLAHPRFQADLSNGELRGHPWNLVLWNVARCRRGAGGQSEFKRFYRRAMELTCENRKNVTMSCFAISMSADRLLWCRRHRANDTADAQKELLTVCRELRRAGMTEEMIASFRVEELERGEKATDEALAIAAADYLK